MAISRFSMKMSYMYVIKASAHFKPQSHYSCSNNQSPTSDNHLFWGGCRRLSEVGDWLSATTNHRPSTNICRPLTTSGNHPKKGGCQRSATGCRYSVTVALHVWEGHISQSVISSPFSKNSRSLASEYLIWNGISFFVHYFAFGWTTPHLR